MNRVVKFENTRKQKLDWKQEEAVKSAHKQHRTRRDLRKGRHQQETDDE